MRAEYTTLIKSELLYCNRLFHECEALNHQACIAGSVWKTSFRFRTKNEKRIHREKTVACTRLGQQLACSVAAAGKDLVPLVERGGGGLEHDQVFLLEAESTQPRGWVG